jgi:phosphatidylinositol-3-phosphatase
MNRSLSHQTAASVLAGAALTIVACSSNVNDGSAEQAASTEQSLHSFCGNGKCDHGETCSTCPRDCGSCPVDSGTPDSGNTDSGATDSGTTDSGATDSGTTDSGPSTSVIQKVFYLMEENRDSNQVYGSSDAPYINNTLMTTYDYASDYTNDVHPSEPNYVWLEAGSNNCGDRTFTNDNDPSNSNSTATLDHLVNYLGRVGKTWKSYQENLPGSCGINSSGNYAAKHNPFVFFQDVVGSYSSPSAFCLSHIVDYSNLATDLANNTLADFIEITPNLCDDGHDCSNPSVETFLQSSTIQAVFNYVLNASNHAILIIDWDESESTNVHPMLLIAPTSTLVGSHNVTTQVDHSSFVRSIQMIFGVDPSHIDPTKGVPFSWLRNASAASDFSSFFSSGQFP